MAGASIHQNCEAIRELSLALASSIAVADQNGLDVVSFHLDQALNALPRQEG